MCTLTLVPHGEGRYRLAFNRDELTSRPAARPPQRLRFGGRTALLPIDPTSGGTWLAVNDAGLALALLNVNPSPPAEGPARGRRSRGTIIPALLGSPTLAASLAGAARLDPSDYSPFRLVVFGRGEVAEVRSDGERFDTRRARVAAPLLFTSSGLGDALVEGPRRRLFEEMLGPGGDIAARQDAFHHHSWPGRTHLSVCMRRDGARTVSHAVLDLNDTAAVLTYHAGAPDEFEPLAA